MCAVDTTAYGNLLEQQQETNMIGTGQRSEEALSRYAQLFSVNHIYSLLRDSF